MIVSLGELEKVKDPDSFKYFVFNVSSKRYYSGNALIAATCVDDANKIIKAFNNEDKDNLMDSGGWSNISKNDYHGKLSDVDGILSNNIYYTG